MSEAVIVGDEKFIERLGNIRQPEQAQPGIETLSVTIDPQGNLIGDTSHLPEHIREQLSSPEAKKQMRQQYRESRYGEKETPRKPKYVNTGGTRDLRGIRAPGQSRADFRKMKHKVFKDLRKQSLQMKRS